MKTWQLLILVAQIFLVSSLFLEGVKELVALAISIMWGILAVISCIVENKLEETTIKLRNKRFDLVIKSLFLIIDLLNDNKLKSNKVKGGKNNKEKSKK